MYKISRRQFLVGASALAIAAAFPVPKGAQAYVIRGYDQFGAAVTEVIMVPKAGTRMTVYQDRLWFNNIYPLTNCSSGMTVEKAWRYVNAIEIQGEA